MNSKAISLNSRIKGKRLYHLALFAAIAVHIIFFIYNLITGSEHIDEIMCILNARSLVDNGTDIMGERLPVYFDTWLFGGQSPFATYLLALFIKLFGYSLFITRLPMLLFSIMGLVAYYYFLKEVFPNNEKLVLVSFALLAFSPWHIANAVYTLDCNFMPHIFIVCLWLLAKGINSGKARFFIASMFFFGLCFYCYIAAALIIPLILFIMYLMLLIKKKISIKNAAISVIAILITAIPFILFGLVHLGYIDEFTAFGFSFSKMPYYTREASINLNNLDMKLTGAIATIILPDTFILINHGMCGFEYTNFIGGIFFLFGIIYFIKLNLKKPVKKIDLGQFNIYGTPFILSALILVPFIYFVIASYRLFCYNYVITIIEAVGIITFAKNLKIFNVKKIMCVFLSCSLAFFTAEFIVHNTSKALYANQTYTKNINDSLYFADTLKTDKIGFSLVDNHFLTDPIFLINYSVILQYHYYNTKNFINLENEFIKFGPELDEIPEEPIKLTEDDSLYFKYIDDGKINDDCIIISHKLLEQLNYDKSKYSVKSFGNMEVLYKTELATAP